MTWVIVIVVVIAVGAAAAWAIPRAARRSAHMDADAVPPSPTATAGGGVPYMPGTDPPPSKRNDDAE